jgi:hypothetical protein
MRQSQPTAQAEGLERRNVATSIPVLIPSQGMKGLEQIVRVFDLELPPPRMFCAAGNLRRQ